eukprot:jgi/Pico_ML_1/51297/g2353.t1
MASCRLLYPPLQDVRTKEEEETSPKKPSQVGLVHQLLALEPKEASKNQSATKKGRKKVKLKSPTHPKKNVMLTRSSSPNSFRSTTVNKP